MRLRNSALVSTILLGLCALAAGQAPAQSSAPQKVVVPRDEAPAPAAKQPPSPAQTGGAPNGEDKGVYVFRKQVEEVVLHATVVDDHRNLVTNLPRSAFTVYENGQPQQITSFRNTDVPVAVGIVIDNSGSMRDKRAAVNQAAINFVRASNPRDEVFIVNFNDEAYLDQDFTDNLVKLRDGLEHIESRGGTALYDAVIASADHLAKDARLEKKVLLVVTDGEDNASQSSLEQAVRKVQAEGGPMVYAIGILGDDHPKRARRALQRLAEETGGVAYFPSDVSQVDAITREVAHDIRSQYIIGYKPSIPKNAGGGFRAIKVVAREKGYRNLQVRTRSGYYVGQERASR
jgi:Ca-activated chloride channel family protein